jgi:predicted transcriptional regulator
MDVKYKLPDAEYRFACIVWDNEPIHSRRLAELCEEKLGWKRTTTYTVLKRLCDRGIVKNVNAMVCALVKREDVQKFESAAVVNRTFGGSLPSFVASFLQTKSLSQEELAELRAMIDAQEECNG